MEIAGAVNYWLNRSGRAVRVYDHGDGAAVMLGVERVNGDWEQLGELYQQMFDKGYVRVAILHAQHEVMVDYRGAMSRPQWAWLVDQAHEERLRIVNDQGHALADYTESRKDMAKNWLMSEEPPLYVDPTKTNPLERLSHTIGTDEDFIAIDYHVFPEDMSVQLHAAVRTEHFVQDFRPPVRVPASDALEAARQLADAALEWMADNDMGPDQEPQAWAWGQMEAGYLIDAIGRELDPDYDARQTNEAIEMVERLIG